MKIAILSPFYPYRGGIAQVSDRLYYELSKYHEVRAFSFTSLYPDFLFPGKTQFVVDDDNIYDIHCDRLLNSINPYTYLNTAQQINRFAPDILIIPYWMSFLAPALGSVCLLLNKKIKVISLVHNAIPHEQKIIDKPLARFFFNRCDAFLTFSDPVRDDLLKLTKQSKIFLYPHPIYDQYGERLDRNEACNQLGVKSNKKNLLFFGLIRDYKGLDILIDAFNKLDDSYQLIIAGEAYGSFERYQKMIDESPFKDNIVVYEQYIADTQVAPLFSSADVLVLPYRSATQSGVVAVAYQMELPMIATNVGALGDAIRSSNTGLVVDSVDASSLTDAIQSFFSNDSLIEKYKDNVRTEKKKLSWDSYISELNKFLEELLLSSS